MFGDMGHGVIMALIAAFMIWKERQMVADKKMNEMVKMLFGGRYIIILMGIFSGTLSYTWAAKRNQGSMDDLNSSVWFMSYYDS